MCRYVSSKARGRAGLDWSAIGLGVAEDAGLVHIILAYVYMYVYMHLHNIRFDYVRRM